MGVAMRRTSEIWRRQVIYDLESADQYFVLDAVPNRELLESQDWSDVVGAKGSVKMQAVEFWSRHFF